LGIVLENLGLNYGKKLKKLRLKQNDGFLIKKRVAPFQQRTVQIGDGREISNNFKPRPYDAHKQDHQSSCGTTTNRYVTLGVD